ncbi:17042_t:CDS:1, partial [Acaulospora colombiana]
KFQQAIEAAISKHEITPRTTNNQWNFFKDTILKATKNSVKRSNTIADLPITRPHPHQSPTK